MVMDTTMLGVTETGVIEVMFGTIILIDIHIIIIMLGI